MKFLTIDTNVGMEVARRFGKDGHTSFYSVINGNPYPKLEDSVNGYGFPEIQKIDDYASKVDESDVIVFTDVGMGALADYLRKQGNFVFGTDRISENLEVDRVYMHNTLNSLGIQTAPHKVCNGVAEVVEELKANPTQHYIKINRFRGSAETFGTDSADDAKLLLSHSGFDLMGKEVKFVLEEELEGVEWGIDAWFNGTDFQPTIAETIEIKDMGNYGWFTPTRESVWWKEVLKKLRPYLSENGYRGQICFEGFSKDGKLSVTDVTCRMSYPCTFGYLTPEFVNWSELIYNTAIGEMSQIETTKKYTLQLSLLTDEKDKWREIHVKDRPLNNMLKRAMMVNDKIYFVPGEDLVCTSVGWGNTFQETFEECKKAKDGVQVIRMYDQFEAVERKVQKKLEELEEEM